MTGLIHERIVVVHVVVVIIVDVAMIDVIVVVHVVIIVVIIVVHVIVVVVRSGTWEEVTIASRPIIHVPKHEWKISICFGAGHVHVGHIHGR